MSEVQAGMLVVATPALTDPNFADTVVLLLDVDEGGALGVVLNRPTGLAVAQVLEAWTDVVTEPEVLFSGGPVDNDGALAVAVRRRGRDEQDEQDERDEAAPVGFRAVLGRLAVVDLDAPVELVGDAIEGMRIFVGYAGWGAGQLQEEVAEGHWYVVPGLEEDVFRPDTTDLWRDVMRRQPGDLAWLSTRPADPELN